MYITIYSLRISNIFTNSQNFIFLKDYQQDASMNYSYRMAWSCITKNLKIPDERFAKTNL